MRALLKFYRSKYKYLVVGYIFLGIGVYCVLIKEKAYYETLFIVSLVQFIIFAYMKYSESKKVKNLNK